MQLWCESILGVTVEAVQENQVPLELRQGHQGPGRVASGKASLHASCEGHLGILLQSVPGPKTLSGVEAGT